MKIVVHNEYNVKEEEVTDKIYRCRAVMINSKNEILLGYLDGTYQFPGGHLEANETKDECLIREIKEETGIDITGKFTTPYYRIIYYTRDYPEDGDNRYIEFNYYLVNTDDKFDMSKTNFDEYEIEYNYQLLYVPISKFEELLNNNIDEDPRNLIIYPDIIDVLNYYLKNIKE